MTFQSPFKYFNFFFDYLGYRMLIAFILSFLVGLLDGIGLALFIPLLKLVSGETSPDPNSGYITDIFIETFQVDISLINVLGLIFLFFSLKGIAKFFESYIHVIYRQLFIRKIRFKNIDLLNNVPFTVFTQIDGGKIQNTVSGEVGRVNTAFRIYFKSFQYFTLVAVYILLAFAADPVFSIAVGLGAGATIIFFKSQYGRTRSYSRDLTEKSHSFEGFLLQKVAFFKYLRTTGLNLFYSKKLKSNILELEEIQKRIGIIDSLLNALREPIVILIVLAAIYLQVNIFNKDLGLIILSLLLLYRALTFFMAMQEQWNIFLSYSGSLENMQAFMDNMNKYSENLGRKKANQFNNSLILKDVSFSYSRNWILKNINLKISKNETVAIVGESGSGKSTLMNLLTGLIFPSKGSYFVDQSSIEEIDLYSFRNHIGYIPQDPVMFNDTIFNNITLWGEKTPEIIRRFQYALKKASIFEFIYELEFKEETILGHNGISLSGGQKQRLCLAREIFKEVDILFLDEATSSLDSETEIEIKDHIEGLKGKITLIIIAHRLSTIKFADRIILLNKGRIELEGTYENLIKDSEHFRRMVELQNV